jgi:hypothetical protein
VLAAFRCHFSFCASYRDIDVQCRQVRHLPDGHCWGGAGCEANCRVALAT